MKYRRASVIALLACVFVAGGSIQARSVVSLPTVNSVEEALKLMDAFEGEAENFRIAIPEQLFDIVGANEAAITDHALSRGWVSDGFMRILSYRVYRFKTAGSRPTSCCSRSPKDGLRLNSSVRGPE
jgi:hypothetical protein